MRLLPAPKFQRSGRLKGQAKSRGLRTDGMDRLRRLAEGHLTRTVQLITGGVGTQEVCTHARTLSVATEFSWQRHGDSEQEGPPILEHAQSSSNMMVLLVLAAVAASVETYENTPDCTAKGVQGFSTRSERPDVRLLGARRK